MKKLVLLFTGLLIGLTTVTAAEKVESAILTPDLDKAGKDLTTKRITQPIKFVERGVEFLIFTDGSFDFNRHNNYNNSPNHGHNRKSNTTKRVNNTSFNAPGTGTLVNYSKPRSRSVIITRDARGKIKRIGNVTVNYNRIGQVKRLGSIFMKYNHRGLLIQIGGLHLKYDRNNRLIQRLGKVNRSS